MKPTKNRVLCPDCGRAKMLFESESKAKNFIKFNGDDIDSHGHELRPYYCPACCGWHISSKDYNPHYEGRTEQLIKNYEADKSIITKLDKILNKEELTTRVSMVIQTLGGIGKVSKMSREDVKTAVKYNFHFDHDTYSNILQVVYKNAGI